MKQVIFDTDIGIDDAMALLFLHYSDDVQLRAVVTGFGNASVDNTTRNALFLADRFGISAPVYRGAAEPVGARLGEGYPDFVHGRNGLGDIEIGTPVRKAEAGSGAQAIVDIVTRQPGEISIVAVGRMTNLAHALDLCEDLPGLVKEVVVMGGAFGSNGHSGNVSPVAEANIAGDPEAADRVCTSGLPLTIVGLDVTQETIATAAFFEHLRSSAGSAGQLIYEISRCYLDFHHRISGVYECPVHDSSAVAYLLQPGLFSTRKAVVRVATTGIAMGQTIAALPGAGYASDSWQDKPVCNICIDVDSRSLLDFYAQTLRRAATNCA